MRAVNLAALADSFWYATLVAIVLALALWESAKPRIPNHTYLARWAINAGVYGVNVFLVFITHLTGALAMVPQPFGLLTERIGEWWTLVIAFLAIDFYAYLIHRIQHQVFFLWRFHAIHHSDTAMDWSTALRHHPVEYLLASATTGLIFGLLGIPAWTLSIYGLIAIAASLVQHVNAVLPDWMERSIRWIVITPAVHRIHHSVDARDYNSNFGMVLPIWDRLLGTYRAAGEVSAMGVEPFTRPEHLGWSWIWRLPFAIRRQP